MSELAKNLDLVDLFDPEVLTRVVLNINRGQFPELDKAIIVISKLKEILRFRSLNIDIQLISDVNGMRKKDVMEELNQLLLSNEKDPSNRFEMLMNIIVGHNCEPTIIDVFNRYANIYDDKSVVSALYYDVNEIIKSINTIKLMSELDCIINDNVKDIVDIDSLRNYTKTSMKRLRSYFKPKSIILRYLKAIQNYGLEIHM